MEEKKITKKKKRDSSGKAGAFSDRLYMEIIKTYLDTESVKETASKLKVSTVKVRRVLITEGLWSSRTSLEIQYYRNQGKSPAEIAALLSISEKAVQQYLPYTRGIYKGRHRSGAALNSADYRYRIQVLQERILRRSRDLMMEKEWKESYESGYGTGLDPIRLHLELVRGYGFPGEAEKITQVLRTYGKVEYGETITRDVLVPDDMPLWALHYTIQKCFGWQNFHLHQFELPREQFEKITDGVLGKYAELVGVVFRSPWMEPEEDFWNDDYESGSFKTWIRRKYTGPYESMCHGEGIWQSTLDLAEWRMHYSYVSIRHIFPEDGTDYYDWPKPITREAFAERSRIRAELREEEKYGRKIQVREEVFAFADIPIAAAGYMSERSCTQLLERLTVGEVFAVHDRRIQDPLFEGDSVPACFQDIMDEDLQRDIQTCLREDSPGMQPRVGCLSDVIYYNYDFGDDWHVKITASFGAEDLVESGRVRQEELEQAVRTLLENHRPVCIAQDGYPVLDDVGGIRGYVQFLKGIHQPAKKRGRAEADVWEEEEEDYGPYEDKAGSLEWARSLGWSRRRSSCQNLL